MKNKFAALHYKKTDTLDVTSSSDTQSIVVKCYDELLKSIKSFQDNIVPNPINFRKKSNSFSTGARQSVVVQNKPKNPDDGGKLNQNQSVMENWAPKKSETSCMEVSKHAESNETTPISERNRDQGAAIENSMVA